MNMMDGLRTLVLLALLTLGKATPLTTVSQIPEVYREVETDGFIVDQQLLTPLTTQAPQSQTTAQQRTMTEEEVEGSGIGESLEELSTTSSTTTQDSIIQDATTQAGTILDATTQADTIQDATTQDDPIQDATTQAGAIQDATTQATSEPFTSTLALPAQSSTVMATSESPSLSNETSLQPEVRIMAEPSDDKEPEETTTAELLSILSIMSESGSGEKSTTIPEDTNRDITTTLPVVAVDVTALLTTPVVAEVGSRQSEKPGHKTPDWIIIVGFLVGLTMLVLICVAIATRDRWNGPHQFNKTAVTLTPVDQQREVELEEFLHKRHPRENGKTEEYTVIPLEELSDSCSS